VADGGLVFAKCGDVLLVLDDDGVHEIEDIDFLENLCVDKSGCMLLATYYDGDTCT